jgi:hypothetical protein
MIFKPEKMRKTMVAKFLGRYVESPKNRIQLDDLYSEYCDFIISNARDYKQTLTEFRKSIVDIFPGAEVKDGAVIGVAKRVKAAPVEVVRDPFDILMGNCYSDMVHEYPKKSFTATELAYFSKQKVEDVENWLQSHPFFYQNRTKNKYTYINGD